MIRASPAQRTLKWRHTQLGPKREVQNLANREAVGFELRRECVLRHGVTLNPITRPCCPGERQWVWWDRGQVI